MAELGSPHSVEDVHGAGRGMFVTTAGTKGHVTTAGPAVDYLAEIHGPRGQFAVTLLVTCLVTADDSLRGDAGSVQDVFSGGCVVDGNHTEVRYEGKKHISTPLVCVLLFAFIPLLPEKCSGRDIR